jgi:DNA-binding HxlR family transcriptional regulator
MKTAKKEGAGRFRSPETGEVGSAELDALVLETIGRVADKWTMIVIEALSEHGVLRFTRLGELVGGISQRMLTKTLRQMEEDGLVTRTVYPVVPPKVEYELTEMGDSLGAAFCGVWQWAERYQEELKKRPARAAGVPTPV